MSVTWKMNLYDADAEKVYSEIQSIGEAVTPQQIVDFARDSNTELHKCFEWNDSVAAEKYRVQQARLVVCHLVYTETNTDNTPSKIRVMQRSDTEAAYKSTRLIFQNRNEYTRLLERAYAELRAFKERYKTLSELEEILALIE